MRRAMLERGFPRAPTRLDHRVGAGGRLDPGIGGGAAAESREPGQLYGSSLR